MIFYIYLPFLFTNISARDTSYRGQEGNVLYNNALGQVRSGQCSTCAFRESCCSAHMSRAQVPGSSVGDRENKGEGSKWGPPALAGTREYEQSDRNR